MHTLLTGFHQHLLWIGQFVLIYVYLPRVHNKERSWPVAYVECTCMQRVMWLGCQFSSYKTVHWLKMHTCNNYIPSTWLSTHIQRRLQDRPVYSLLFCNVLLTLLHVHADNHTYNSFSLSRSTYQLPAADEERPTSTTADAAPSAESVGNSSFGEVSSATPVPIGQHSHSPWSTPSHWWVRYNSYSNCILIVRWAFAVMCAVWCCNYHYPLMHVIPCW